MAKLTGKVAVVTGASKGIGAEIAKSLGAEGASVVVNYASSREGADKIVAEITAAGGKAFAVQGDVSKAEDVTRLFAETKKAYGKLDILVNNAGVYKMSPLEGVTEEDFHWMYNINVLGLLLATQAAAPLFGAEGGSVINIGSVVSSLNMPNSAIYTSTKHAVDGITQVLAKELGPKKIRVNALNPGVVDTEGARTLGMIGSPMEQAIIAQTPLGRSGQPKDIADIAVFLASDDSYWLTGELLFAGGGLK